MTIKEPKKKRAERIKIVRYKLPSEVKRLKSSLCRSCSIRESLAKMKFKKKCKVCGRQFLAKRIYAKYCSEECRKKAIREWEKMPEHRKKKIKYMRKYNREHALERKKKWTKAKYGEIGLKKMLKVNFSCEICGRRAFRAPNLSKVRQVVLHHIDWDPSNNSEDNLLVLCQKHHSELHHFITNSYLKTIPKDFIIKKTKEWLNEGGGRAMRHKK